MKSVMIALGQCTKPHEEFLRCGNHKSCVTTCMNKDVKHMACPRICKSGCFCKGGYVRDANNNCIDPAKCPGNRAIDLLLIIIRILLLIKIIMNSVFIKYVLMTYSTRYQYFIQ